MKLISLIIILFFSSIHSQNIKNDIIPIGYFIKPINPKPVLFVIFNKSDTLKLMTNKLQKLDKIIKTDMIKSIDVLKDKEANKTFKELAKYGVVMLEVKNENWEYIYSNQKRIDSLDISSILKNRKDTIYLNNSIKKIETAKYKKLFIGKNQLTVREKVYRYQNNDIQLFIKNNELSVNSEGFNNLKIDFNGAKKIIEPLFTISSNQKSYSLVYDTDINKIIWYAYATKKHFEKDKTTIEFIEINALTGEIISQRINDDVQIMIR